MNQRLIYVDDSYSAVYEYFFDKNIKNIFVVCGKSFYKLAIANYFKKITKAYNLNVDFFSEFTPNPRYESVVDGLALFKKKKYDIIIAAGGGSAIDVAKCIKLYSNMPEGCDYLNHEIIANNTPFLVIPTTAGTGSEATRYAVIYYDGKKQSITDDSIIPDVVIYDYRVLKSLPEYQKKATMMDALCHGIEAYWSVNSTNESKVYSEHAIRLILQNYRSYLLNDTTCFKSMMLASYFAGKAINIAQTTAGHAMSYKLTSLYGLAHGHAVALCVSVLWEYMLIHLNLCKDERGEQYIRKMFNKLGQIFSSTSSFDASEKFREMLRELELFKPDLQSVCDIALLTSSVNKKRLQNNPIYLNLDNIEILYKNIIEI